MFQNFKVLSFYCPMYVLLLLVLCGMKNTICNPRTFVKMLQMVQTLFLQLHLNTWVYRFDNFRLLYKRVFLVFVLQIQKFYVKFFIKIFDHLFYSVTFNYILDPFVNCFPSFTCPQVRTLLHEVVSFTDSVSLILLSLLLLYLVKVLF